MSQAQVAGLYIATGGSAGIGFGIVAPLLQHNPAKVYLLSNKEQHVADAQTDLAELGDANRSPKQTGQAVRQLVKELDQLDALVCNAGLGVDVYSATVDGLDSCLQLNHFAQAHLALALPPFLQKTTDSRLIFVPSNLRRAAPSSTEFASIEKMNKDIGATPIYNRTKLAQALFARELVRRVKV